ncbi:MAG: BatD family protein [Phycisphaerae bacterium]|nr:BatD family protein [Phycisphaerae bacterium]
MSTSITTKSFLAGVGTLLVSSLSVWAAELSLRLSSREAYVGAPIVARLSVDNSGAHDVPVFPDIPGVTVQPLGVPARSSQTTIINGRRSQRSSITYAYELTPRKEGKFVIPAVKLTADGRTLTTEPVAFVARKSDTGDLLFVDVAGGEKRAYVGEALRLTLRIWIRPYVDGQYHVKLTEADMWGLISPERSRWGVFAKALDELAAQRQRPRGREVLRKDSEGVERSYYLYELDHVIRPAKPGRLDPGDVDIVTAYPTGLQQADGFFSMGELALSGTRPLVKQATVEPIEIRAIPTDNRPAGYNGAIGRYDISATALPKKVAVGEPLTLTLKICGEGNLETLAAPDLANLPELTKDFRVPDEPLAGVMENGAKVFTVSLRPRDANVKQIPPIRMAYFDPRIERFVTSRSESIRLHVTPAETLSLDRVVSAAPNTETPKAPTPVSPASTLTPTTVSPALLRQPRMLTGGRLIATLVAPPLGCIVLATERRRRRRRVDSHRRRLAGKLAKERLTEAEDVTQIASTVIGYIADRLDEPARNLTAAEAVGRLRLRGGSKQILDVAADLLADCEEFRYCPSTPHDLEMLSCRAKQCVDVIEADMRKGRS